MTLLPFGRQTASNATSQQQGSPLVVLGMCAVVGGAWGWIGCGGDPALSAGTSAAPSEAASPESAAETTRLGLPHEALVEDRIFVGGPPDAEALARAERLGITTVISLQTPSEPQLDDEGPTVESLGMQFVSIPIRGAEGVTEDNARAVNAALEQASGKVLLHCGSGNRAAAMIALRAFHVQGRNRAEALELGKSAGLTKLEPKVVAHLDAVCAKEAGSARCSAP